VASFVLGLLAGISASPDTAALFGVGFCGTLSTYSTFSFETMRLSSTGRDGWAAANVGLSLLIGFAAAAAGWAIGAQ
jgi:fluoride exporter